MYNLFLDDMRMPIGAFTYTKNSLYRDAEWVIVRDYKSFVSCIVKRGMPDLISFDHDLADIHYKSDLDDYEISRMDDYEKTGYDCAKWLVNYCMDNKFIPPPYLVHSGNPVGSANIKGVIESYKKFLGIF